MQGAQPGDSLFWHFSGHGSQAEDTSGDEQGGKDDTICPADYASAGQIIDDDLKVRVDSCAVLSLCRTVQMLSLDRCCWRTRCRRGCA